MIHKKTFVNAELNGSYQLVYTHNLQTVDIIPCWKDETGIFRSIGDLFQVQDENTVILNCNEVISGTHTLLLKYVPAGAVANHRRLFELDLTVNPETAQRLVLGNKDTQYQNMTLAGVLAWLYTKLGFLKKASNLSDLTNALTARTNLGIYSQAEINALNALKASLYQAGSGYVLGTTNTSLHIATENYNPIQLANVKNIGFKMLFSGHVSSAGVLTDPYNFLNSDILDEGDISCSRSGTGTYQIMHGLGSYDYFVIANVVGSGTAVGIGTVLKEQNSFTIHTADDDSLNDAQFEFHMFAINSFLSGVQVYPKTV